MEANFGQSHSQTSESNHERDEIWRMILDIWIYLEYLVGGPSTVWEVGNLKFFATM